MRDPILSRLRRRSVRAVLALLVLVPSLACRAPEAAFDNVVLVTLDTVRADHLGCYGYPRDTTPFLDELAREGVLFERAVGSSSHTAPAHASMLTSLYPPQHGVLLNGQRLPDGIVTGAELFAEAGFETAAVVSVRFLRRVARGFDRVLKPPFERGGRPGPAVPYRPADATVDVALSWLEHRDRERPFFLWVHLFDPHERHDSSVFSADLLERMRRDSAADPDAWLDFLETAHGVEADAVPALLEENDRYDAQIAFADRELRRLARALEEEGSGLRRLWAVTSDHGEGLGSRGYLYHDWYLYGEQIRIPLILSGGPGWRRGIRVDRLVRQVDLLPTLLELAGVPVEPRWSGVEGRSLLPLLDGSPASPPIRFAFAQRRASRIPGGDGPGLEGGLMIAARTSRYKYIHVADGEDEFYDLEDDPLERFNLIDAPIGAKTRLASWLLDTYRRMRTETPEEARAPPALDEETLEELRALGYL